MNVRLHAALLVGAVLVSGVAGATSPITCARRLTLEVTPDVPDPRDTSFLSSLLSNDVGYQLVFLGRTDDTNIVLELIGPGPAYRCRDAIQTMRKDARVASIHVSPGQS
jgi:hypothetical protein